MTANAPIVPPPRAREDRFDRLWKRIRKWRHYSYLTYEVIGFLFRRETSWRLMNFGYAPTADGNNGTVPKDEPQAERFALQLYHFVASAAPLKGRELLEVGCGRGGGLSFVGRTLGVARATGVDFSRQVIAFCRRTYARETGLRFQVANAMDLPFSDASFDAVLNVESSHNYPSRGQFYGQVFRVLRPGGAFLYSDVLPDHQYGDVAAQLRETGFDVVEQELINDSVMRSMELDNDRRVSEIKRLVPSWLHSMARLFAGSTDSYPYRKLQTGHSRYFRILAWKPA